MAGRDYSMVKASFWTGETGRMLRGDRDAQVISLYLITCGSCNMIGLYYLPLPLLCHEIGSPLEGALKGLQRASEALFAHYDRMAEVVFIPEMAAHQVGETLHPKDNRHKSVVKLWQEMAKSRFYMDFYSRYGEAYQLPEPKPLRSPLEAPSEPLRSQEQEQEQDKEQENTPLSPPLDEFSLKPSSNGKPKAKPKRRRVGDQPNPYSEDFERFWELYPRLRREKKGKAWEAWQKAICRASVEVILDAIEEFAESELARLDRCQGPAPWLNQDCWADARESWNPSRTAEQLIDRVATKEDLANWSP